jgi:GNAT superfamily N-acetyltransferase
MEDAEQIAILSGQLGYPTKTAAMDVRLGDLLALDNHAIIVADGDADRLDGWVHVYMRSLVMLDRHGELGGLVVAEGARGRGIGEALLAAAESWVQSQGGRLMIVRSNQVRQDAHRFYHGMGYEAVKHSMVFHKDIR